MKSAAKELVVKRIRAASADCPIAVFSKAKKGVYDAMFLNTVRTQNWIDRGDKGLIGVFYGDAGVVQFTNRTAKKSEPLDWLPV